MPGRFMGFVHPHGEIHVEDIRFETVAGEHIGRYTEEEGRLKRVALRDSEFAGEAAGRDTAADGTDPTTMDVDAAPHPAGHPRSRPQLDKARDIIDKTFDKFRRS